MLKFFPLALAVLTASGSAFARDAKIACSTGKTFEQAQYGISLSAASYAKAGYRVSAPTMRRDPRQTVMCIAVVKN